MPFTVQPYPLFLAFWEGDTPTTGRIIGWVAPDDEQAVSSRIQPVAVLRNADGGVSEPRYVDLEDEPAWMADTETEARNLMQNRS